VSALARTADLNRNRLHVSDGPRQAASAGAYMPPLFGRYRNRARIFSTLVRISRYPTGNTAF